MERAERFVIAEGVVAIGFWSTVVLAAVKLLAGHFGDSEAVFADGLESASDFLVMLLGMAALKVGRKPLDERHPYGHGKAESLSAVLASIIIFGTGLGILYTAVSTVITKHYSHPHMVAVLVAAATIAIKEFLFRYSRRAANRLSSPALEAIAQDHRKDAASSLATLIGVGGAYLGAPILDPLAAGLTALLIFNIARRTFLSAADELMDGRPSEDLIESVASLAEGVPGVEHVHDIRCRRSGQFLIVDLKLEMDPEMTVKDSHAITTVVKRLIFERFPSVGDVMIHINPHDDGNHQDMTRL